MPVSGPSFTWEQLVFSAVFLSFSVEIFLLNSWNPWYFTWGIPLFRRTYGDSSAPAPDKWPTAAQLERVYNAKGIRFPAIVFHKLSATEYAFRHKWFTFGQSRSFPVIRGLMRWNIASGEVIVVGYVNWYTVLILGLWLWPTVMVNALARPIVPNNVLAGVLAGLFFTTLAGLLYAIQSRGFDEVGKLASRAWHTGTTTTDMVS